MTTIQQRPDAKLVLQQSVDNDRPIPVSVVVIPKAALNRRWSCAYVELFMRAVCSGPGRKR
jgi:hypothetical protein